MLAAVVGTASLCGLPSAAQATQFVVILLDNTGSMALPGSGATSNHTCTTATVTTDCPSLGFGVPQQTCNAGYCSGTRWDQARTAAVSHLTLDSDLDTGANNVAFSVWEFRKDPSTTLDAWQVWPSPSATPLSAGCPTGTTYVAAPTQNLDPTNNATPASFCQYARNTTVQYSDANQIQDFLLNNPAMTVEPLNTYQDTSLAGGLCQVLRSMRGVITDNSPSFQFILESDGGENDTEITNLCYGGESGGTADGDTAVPGDLDWGLKNVDGTTSGATTTASPTNVSWEQRVLRFAVNYSHYVNASIVPGNDPAAPWIVNPVTGAMSAALVWKVDIQYAFSYGPAFVPAPLTLSPSSPVASDLHQQMVAALTGNANPAPAIAMTGDILTPELNFYHYLGQSTPGSSTRDLALIPGTVYGVPHPVPGDVDNSGCTDQADLSQLLQSDTWMHQAVLPNHHAIQADVNADGWVNQFDVNIVLANWGAGCTVLPQPPKGGYVAIPYVPTTLAATPSATQVSLTWKASSMATSYNVLRSTTGGSGFVTLASGVTATSYTDTTVTAGTTYYYEVSATDSQGTSAPSAQVSATVASEPPLPCANPVTWTNGEAGAFNTTGAVCGRVAGTIQGWGCANFDGRTVQVDEEAATCGEAPLPAPWSDGYTYFSVSAGTRSYASIYWW